LRPLRVLLDKLVVSPLALHFAAIGEGHGALAVHHAVLPLAHVGPDPRDGKGPLAVVLAFSPFTDITGSVRIDMCPGLIYTM